MYKKCSASECANLGRQMYERKGGEKGDRRGKVIGEERWQERKGDRRERMIGEKG